MMAPEVNNYFEVLEKGLAVLRQLARDLQESCTALAGLDLNGIYQHIAHQEYLAEAFCRLDQERKAWELAFAETCGLRDPRDFAHCLSAEIGPEGEKRYRALRNEIAASQRAVRQGNRLYAALLARSRQTANALLNGLGSLQVTYPVLGPDSKLSSLVSSRT
jgi:hypothetical protein